MCRNLSSARSIIALKGCLMSKHLIGVISDTHGLVRPQVVQALQGVELIIHAGDLGDLLTLEALAKIAPVRAVRGNVDRGAWAAGLRESEIVEVGGVSLYVIHDFYELDLNPRAAGFAAVIYGHSHQPSVEWREEVLLLNPGSAGPRRFKLPVSLALLQIDQGRLEPTLVRLED
jgi:uncharacterized protein